MMYADGQVEGMQQARTVCIGAANIQQIFLHFEPY